jgi:MoaA/NifB/PqqE/SkfB family radical SAM enzyme
MIALQSAINAFNTAKKAGIKVKKTSILINRSKTPLSDKKLKLIKDAGLNIMGYIDFLEEIRDKSEFGRRIGVIKNKELIAAFEKV